MKRLIILAALLLPMTSQASSDEAKSEGAIKSLPVSQAILKSPEGEAMGSVNITQGDNGLLVDIDAKGLSEGWHAIHIHEKADCATSDFKSAGGHAKASDGEHQHHAKIHGQTHGFLKGDKMHPGDLANIWANDDGISKAQQFIFETNLAEFNDADGAAVIIHQGADDYSSQPSGNAGARVACGALVFL